MPQLQINEIFYREKSTKNKVIEAFQNFRKITRIHSAIPRENNIHKYGITHLNRSSFAKVYIEVAPPKE